jgi:hypothetical protein
MFDELGRQPALPDFYTDGRWRTKPAEQVSGRNGDERR